ncbi:MAG: dihydroneopterin aldolase [Candidatus Wallacebacter cryptica]|nr:dihydroneopterin aldolase [Bacillota bacterium]
MSDKIVLKNMRFYGYHGAFDVERELGQKFAVDLEVYTDLRNIHDDTELSFNYVDAYTMIKDIVEEQEFNLVETLAEEIAEQILSAYDVEKVVVRVRKSQVPVGGSVDYLEVEITRP